MLERLGLHVDALRVYCKTLGDLPLAEAYCDRYGLVLELLLKWPQA